ncbi:hypothetical protein C427_1409 [Paraglaciecola psychrophila 170]|uniref:Uncharacterized protein n=1 Tax=Paraglaciecola psychrophila 170 TaxID=1129794 RepID=K6Z3D2_9ALTE|nr:hypothetical protein C427_1409 [Paraglaciecola psychrophila 170]GAC39569.1 hypothetical protein GPSY_3958 [Paraglaciecola psychrophila 170]
MMSRLLNRFPIPYSEEPSHHDKAVIEEPRCLIHQKSNDFIFQQT